MKRLLSDAERPDQSVAADVLSAEAEDELMWETYPKYRDVVVVALLVAQVAHVDQKSCLGAAREPVNVRRVWIPPSWGPEKDAGSGAKIPIAEPHHVSRMGAYEAR